jgi:phosphate transport system permease protein
MKLYTRRRIVNAFNLSLSVATTAFGLFWLAWLLWTLFSNGFQWLGPEIFAKNTPPPGSAGGLANAVMGSVIITGVATLIGTPMGVLVGTYLAEFGRYSRIASIVRFINDVLLSAPSIIIGVFIYSVFVVSTGHFSGWAGSLALALIMIPVITRTTEDMMRLVPDSLREAAAALGAARWRVISAIVYRASVTGILTGVLLGVARISGETAPLLFTTLNNQFWSTDMNHPMPNLPVVIFQFAMSPYDDWHHLAWAGALLITLSVLALNIVARTVLRPRRVER